MKDENSFFDYDSLFQHETDISLYIFILNTQFRPTLIYAYNLKDPPFIHIMSLYVQDIHMLLTKA